MTENEFDDFGALNVGLVEKRETDRTAPGDSVEDMHETGRTKNINLL